MFPIMFINSSWTYLLSFRECSLTIWFMAIHEQSKFMNKMTVMNKISSWSHDFSWKFHLLFKNVHEQFMNTLIARFIPLFSWTLWWTVMNVHSFLFTNIHEIFMNVHEQFMMFSPGKFQWRQFWIYANHGFSQDLFHRQRHLTSRIPHLTNTKSLNNLIVPTISGFI